MSTSPLYAASAQQIVARLSADARFAGSKHEDAARKYCGELLAKLGFTVQEQEFEFSRAPGTWGPSVFSALAAGSVWYAGYLAGPRNLPVVGLVVLVLGLAAASLLGFASLRTGVSKLPWLRTRSRNLVATRDSSVRPSIWLVAHIDSKSQTIPMLVRVASTVVFALFSALVFFAIIVLIMRDIRDPQEAIVAASTFLKSLLRISSWLAVVAAAPMVLCFIGNRSRGALDNATGVAAVVLAAEIIGTAHNVGVVITTGEELGLAGTRHFASTEPDGKIAINCDTIDDEGHFYCMASGRRPPRLVDALSRITTSSESQSSPERLRLRSMIPGILADNVAFSAAGWESFTLSRGNLRTLSRVHTSGDVAEHLQGSGVAKAAALIAAIVKELA